MSSRFHNKWHRHNHHTAPIGDSKYPDASHDPIASYDSPFLGDFVTEGGLVLKAPNGNRFKVSITNSGSLSSVAI
jgi:hypothetical protein